MTELGTAPYGAKRCEAVRSSEATEVRTMEGEFEEGWSIAPKDKRDSDAKWEVREDLSSTNTGFGGKDPAIIEEPTGTPSELAFWDLEDDVEVEG